MAGTSKTEDKKKVRPIDDVEAKKTTGKLKPLDDEELTGIVGGPGNNNPIFGGTSQGPDWNQHG
jgi:hypothetical protein